MRLKLEIQPIPISSWGMSLANKLGKEGWDKIRQKVYEGAGYKCEVCGSGGELHCHEVWKFDDRKKVQRLAGFMCVCETCHNVIHFGRSMEVYDKEYVDKLRKHWCKVNGKSLSDFSRYEKEVFEVNKRRASILYVVKVGRKVLI